MFIFWGLKGSIEIIFVNVQTNQSTQQSEITEKQIPEKG